MPSHILATHICTYVLSLRSDDEGACVAAHLEWEQRSKPEREGEETVMKTKHAELRVENTRHLPDPVWVQRSQVSQMPRFQVSCKERRAYHEGNIQGVAEASAEEGIRAEAARGNGTYHEVRTVNMEGMSDLTRQYWDLQALRS